jgi:hypothetical protein
MNVSISFVLVFIASAVLVLPATANYVESPAHRNKAKELGSSIRYQSSGDKVLHNNTLQAKALRSSDTGHEFKKSVSRRLFPSEDGVTIKKEIRSMKITSSVLQRDCGFSDRHSDDDFPKTIMRSSSPSSTRDTVLERAKSLANLLGPVLVWIQLLWEKMKDSAAVSHLCSKIPGLTRQIVPSTPIRSAVYSLHCCATGSPHACAE